MRFDKQNIFFISDFHLSHHNVIKHDNRPFKNVDEMHYELIKNWNSVVNEDDVVFYLGDLSFGKDSLTKWFINSLVGEIHFILGNHDKMRDIVKLGRFKSIHPYGCEIWIKDDDVKSAKGSGGYQQFILSHYPILSWNRSHYGSYHLHGHSHGKLIKYNPDYYKRKVMDVGCNCIDYTPISYLQVKDIMNKKEIIAVDHHGE